MSPRLAFLATLLLATPVFAAPKISVTPASWDFGTLGVLAKSTKVFTVTNVGVDPLTIFSWVIDDPFQCSCWQIQNAPNLPLQLKAGGSVTFEVLTSPQVEGQFVAEVDIDSNDPQTPTAVIPLRMKGAQAGLKVMPFTLDFGTIVVGKTSMPQDTTLTNTGGAPLTFKSFTLSGSNPTQFSFTDPGMLTLNPGQSRMLSVTCAPLAAGNFSASLVMTPQGFAPVQVKLSCSGFAIHLSLDIEAAFRMINFSYFAVGLISPPVTVHIRNNGDVPLDITAIASSNKNFLVDNPFPVDKLAVGAVTQFNVAFAPMANGPLTGSIDIDSGTYGRMGSIAVAGIGVGGPDGGGASGVDLGVGGAPGDLGYFPRGGGTSGCVVARRGTPSSAALVLLVGLLLAARRIRRR